MSKRNAKQANLVLDKSDPSPSSQTHIPDPNHTPDDILKIATEIAESKLYPLSYKKDFFTEKYPLFASTYSKLLEKCCEPNVDMSFLRFMIARLKQVQSNHTSVHNASVAVGSELVNAFVKPALDKA